MVAKNDFDLGRNYVVRDFDNVITGVYPTIDEAIRNCPARMGRIECVYVAHVENLGR